LRNFKRRLLALPISAALAAGAGAAEPGVAPFAAQYVAEWHGIAVGVSDLDLRTDDRPDRYVYTWRVSARGIFRLVYPHPVTQKSWFGVSGGHVVPERYHADDGNSTVDLEFDWPAGLARGTSAKKPVLLHVPPGTQDLMSIQVEIMQDLRLGAVPAVFRIVDKDEVKEFNYVDEGAARIRTALGAIDTRIVASRRAGSNRVLRMWFAPSLGFVPVQAVRSRGGDTEFAMRIKSLAP
jgi:hypothetical protein